MSIQSLVDWTTLKIILFKLKNPFNFYIIFTCIHIYYGDHKMQLFAFFTLNSFIHLETAIFKLKILIQAIMQFNKLYYYNYT